MMGNAITLLASVEPRLGGPGEPWYVVDKDAKTNTVFVERGDDHPRMYSYHLKAKELSWVAGVMPDFHALENLSAKNRYRQNDQSCQVEVLNEDEILVTFQEAQRAITLRQSVVFYADVLGERVCLGGGMINELGLLSIKTWRQLPQLWISEV